LFPSVFFLGAAHFTPTPLYFFYKPMRAPPSVLRFSSIPVAPTSCPFSMLPCTLRFSPRAPPSSLPYSVEEPNAFVEEDGSVSPAPRAQACHADRPPLGAVPLSKPPLKIHVAPHRSGYFASRNPPLDMYYEDFPDPFVIACFSVGLCSSSTSRTQTVVRTRLFPFGSFGQSPDLPFTKTLTLCQI